MNNNDIQNIDDLFAAIQQAEERGDLEALESFFDYFQESEEPAALPLSVSVEFDPKKVSDSLVNTEGDVALASLNSLARATRNVKYRWKRRNYSGPIMVSEGDSWFQYPLRLKDTIDHLMEPFAIRSLGGAGHLFSDMLAENEYTEAIQREGAHYFLICGGGNDMVHSGRLAGFLHEYQEGASADELIYREGLDQFLEGLIGGYEQMNEGLVRRFPNLRILCHGYDWVLPTKGGKWLGTPLAERKVPTKLWNEVLAILIDELNIALKSLEISFPGRFFHVNCRGAVGDSKGQWHDEMHPKSAGYGRVAARFEEAVRVISRGSGSSRELQPISRKVSREESLKLACQNVSRPESARRIQVKADLNNALEMMPSVEAIIGDDFFAGLSQVKAVIPERAVISRETNDPVESITATDEKLAEWRTKLDATDHVAYRHVIELLGEEEEQESNQRIDTRRELMPGNDPFSMERIIGDSQIFQVNFLARGQRAAMAVGRITVMNRYGIAMGFGTGFLVAPGILLTNHHVLSRKDYAASSYVLFDYEYDADNGLKQTVRFDLSDELYLSSPDLDFAFVAVKPRSREGRDLRDFGHLFLIRESGKALKGEPVSIFQHANGLPKQIAMRNSTVLGRRDDFVYYTTDTHSGSSGSPVVSDEWFPVALHHRAVPDINKANSYVANRGIRISSIYRELEDLADRGEAKATEILKRIEPRIGTSASSIPGKTFDDEGGSRQERNKEPYHEIPYDNREGYDADFLGVTVPRPLFRDPEYVAHRLDNESAIIDYEHFSVVMHKWRRLPLFSASNVDASPERKKPEEGRNYSRKGLSGLGENDREKWFTDPRIADGEQLPDRFFTKDDTAFDKGHNVRRDDVAWGDSYEEVRRANGDTYHTTNCTPQVKGFNRSNLGGIWGELENIILRQAKQERYCVFSGPVLDPSDKVFKGKDHSGDVEVQIPSKYWKVVVARNEEDVLESFAFLLEQDLSQVPLEFSVDSEWRSRMVSISALEVILREVIFPQEIHEADQIDSEMSEMLRTSHSIELFNPRQVDGF